MQTEVEKLGRQVAEAREGLKLSPAEVAARAETSPTRVYSIEGAKNFARIDTLIRVAKVVGLEVTLAKTAP